jgi:glycosyltransferase involved in cell wall biosynthesis
MFFPIPRSVIWHQLGIGHPDIRATWRQRFSRAIKIRSVIKTIKPDVFVAFQVGAFALVRVSVAGMKIPGIAAERNAPTLFNFIHRGKIKYSFYQLVLNFAEVISVQFEDYREMYRFGLRKKIVVTPNIVANQGEVRKTKPSDANLRILFIGRLTFQKNVQALIVAASLVTNRSVRIDIVGEGQDLEEIRELATSLNVNVVFHSFQKDLSGFYLDADLLCMPSRWEGFPNVVAEALAFGLPVIGYKNCAGVSSLVKMGINGELAEGNESPESLSQVIRNFDVKKYVSDEIQQTVAIYNEKVFAQTWLSAVQIATRRHEN